MAEMKAQEYLQTYYAERAAHRGNHARRASGRSEVRYAEAFQRVHPAGGGRAVTVWDELAGLGSATVYEAAGREGLVDAPLIQVVPGSRAAGPARTVRCGQDDNLMVHAVMAEIEPGDVVVLTMPEPAPVALVGELLATQAAARGAAALLVDAAVRDVEELASIGPADLGALDPDPRRDEDAPSARSTSRCEVGGCAIHPGDAVVLDADGAAVVASARVGEVLEAARARAGEGARQARGARGGCALLRPRRAPRPLVEDR